MAKNPNVMTKPELVAEALRLGLGPSKSALDARFVGDLRRQVIDAWQGGQR